MQRTSKNQLRYKNDFNKYKTFAFCKKGIYESKISDLDKRIILRAIEKELTAKGMTKSGNHDFLVSIFAKAQKHIDLYNTWYPYYYTRLIEQMFRNMFKELCLLI